jgi:hypothetical protein
MKKFFNAEEHEGWRSEKLRAGVPPVEQTFQDRGARSILSY